jgi:hypothetical protein
MNDFACAAPLDERTLIEYWLGELPEGAEAAVDEHILGCGHCSARLGELVALAGGIRDALRHGKVHAFVSDSFIKSLAGQGLHVREYRVPRNGSVNCTVTAEDDLLIGRLEAPLAGVTRLDVVIHSPGLPGEVRQDVPFDPARGEVVVVPNMVQLRAAPSHRLRLELIAVDDDGRRTIGEYIFNHTAPTA